MASRPAASRSLISRGRSASRLIALTASAGGSAVRAHSRCSTCSRLPQSRHPAAVRLPRATSYHGTAGLGLRRRARRGGRGRPGGGTLRVRRPRRRADGRSGQTPPPVLGPGRSPAAARSAVIRPGATRLPRASVTTAGAARLPGRSDRDVPRPGPCVRPRPRPSGRPPAPAGRPEPAVDGRSSRAGPCRRPPSARCPLASHPCSQGQSRRHREPCQRSRQAPVQRHPGRRAPSPPTPGRLPIAWTPAQPPPTRRLSRHPAENPGPEPGRGRTASPRPRRRRGRRRRRPPGRCVAISAETRPACRDPGDRA